MATWLVTGGAGFIGGNFVIEAIANGHTIVNLDALTYAGNLETLACLSNNPAHHFVKGNIADHALVTQLLTTYHPTAVVHFAAESHVDRSIDGPCAFINTNIVGTFSLLESVKSYWNTLDEHEKHNFRFLHISTDEVYGTLGASGRFTEQSPYAPNSPYSASKAASDHLVRAYFHTYGLPVLTTNCSNNYGPYHFPEKLIPLTITKALANEALPVYGDGKQIRDWLYVVDHCCALRQVITHAEPGANYNIGGNAERENITVVQTICHLLDQHRPRTDGKSYTTQITHVTDRPGHDRRYAIDASKIRKELNWEPAYSFDDGLERTVNWYLQHQDWVNHVLDGSYRLQRMGKGE